MTLTTTGVTCGNCHAKHPSVLEVRACYGTRYVAPGTAADLPPLPATEKQMAFLIRLLDERMADTSAERAAVAARLIAQGRKDVSIAITHLLLQPKLGTTSAAPYASAVPTAAIAQPVPAGRYAIGEKGDTKFYRVARPTEGRWAGYAFVKVQASDEFYPVRGSAAREVLAKIAVDPKAAMLRYGLELGACGHCGRTLTRPESIERGIGPVCYSKMGW